MKTSLSAALVAALLTLTTGPVLSAETPANATGAAAAPQTALTRLPAKGGVRLQVTSPAFADGGDIPFENPQYRGNLFPGLAWSQGPAATRSYVMIMQDADLIYRGALILHGSIINIPAASRGLSAAMTALPSGAANGPNYKGGGQPFLGPHTPPAPSTTTTSRCSPWAALPDAAAASYDALTAAMEGHVLASGEVVGLGQADPNAPPPAPKPAPVASPPK